MKKINLLILTLTALILCNCSSSENEEITENFLQKFDKTVWKHTDQNNNITYYIFKNDKNKPVTSLSDISNYNSNCYHLRDGFGQLNSATYGNELTLSIRTDEIEIFSNYGDNENYTDTFTISGNNLMHKHTENYYNNINEWEYELIKTNLSESDLTPICP